MSKTVTNTGPERPFRCLDFDPIFSFVKYDCIYTVFAWLQSRNCFFLNAAAGISVDHIDWPDCRHSPHQTFNTPDFQNNRHLPHKTSTTPDLNHNILCGKCLVWWISCVVNVLLDTWWMSYFIHTHVIFTHSGVNVFVVNVYLPGRLNLPDQPELPDLTWPTRPTQPTRPVPTWLIHA